MSEKVGFVNMTTRISILRGDSVIKQSKFRDECESNIAQQKSDPTLATLTRDFFQLTFSYKYSYNFEFLGRPIIQYPQDVIAIQELIWKIRPDLIIETGIAHGGSLVMNASMLALLDLCDAIELGKTLDPHKSARKVLGIDIDIRANNRMAIEAHPLASRIHMIQGSSIAPNVVEEVWRVAEQYNRVMVCLDSNHSHDHVLAELQAYAPLTSIGSYCVVFDTIVEDMPAEMFTDRQWGPGNSPKTAVWKYLEEHQEFDIDMSIHQKLLITVAPEGYLKRVS